MRPQHLRQNTLDKRTAWKASTFAACDESWALGGRTVTNTAVLEKRGSLSMHLMLCQRRLRWLVDLQRMEDGRIPKDLLFGLLALGCRPVGRPVPRYKDVCKRDLKPRDINPDSWEKFADDKDGWHHAVRNGVRSGEEKRNLQPGGQTDKTLRETANRGL